jgi:ABC-type transport system involved in cytochrome c biogenesis permease subunit
MENLEAVLFNLAFAGYVVGFVLYAFYAGTKRDPLSLWGHRLLASAVILHTVSLAVRAAAARTIPEHSWYVPWSNWFESFSLFALLIAASFIIVQVKTRLPILGVFVLPWNILALVMAFSYPFFSQPDWKAESIGEFFALANTARALPKLQPALQSFWMAIHVPVMFVSYAAFAVAFGVGLAYIVQERQIRSKKPSELSYRLPPLEDLDRLIYRIIATAFPVLTLGIILGAAAHRAGRALAFKTRLITGFTITHEA